MNTSAKASVLCALLALLTACASQAASQREVWGWVEKAEIEPPWNAEVKAKLDTGALTSSLQADHIERFKRKGEHWVRFRVRIEDEDKHEYVSRTFERPLYRRVKVTGAGGSDHRPVVLMRICMGDTVREEQFTLEDRGNMLYPMLIGRRTIQHLGLVDVKRTFIHQPGCPKDAATVRHEDMDSDPDIGD